MPYYSPGPFLAVDNDNKRFIAPHVSDKSCFFNYILFIQIIPVDKILLRAVTNVKVPDICCCDILEEMRALRMFYLEIR